MRAAIITGVTITVQFQLTIGTQKDSVEESITILNSLGQDITKEFVDFCETNEPDLHNSRSIETAATAAYEFVKSSKTPWHCYPKNLAG